jgi:hypothetical protein
VYWHFRGILCFHDQGEGDAPVVEAADSSETSVYFYQMTLHDILEDVSVICEEKCILF